MADRGVSINRGLVSWLFVLALAVSWLWPQAGLAQKLKFATSVKIYAVFYLPVLTAEKEALWQKNGLDVEWVSTKGGGAMMRAMAAGALNIGLTPAATAIKAAAAGVPAVIVANLYPKEPFYIWVRSDSRIKKPKDLSGAKIGVAKYGGMEHVYMQIITKALGLEGKTKVVSVGGLRAVVAGLRSKAIDSGPTPGHTGQAQGQRPSQRIAEHG